MSKGVFSGFKRGNLSQKSGLVALLKNRLNSQYELIYIDKEGKKIFKNEKEILQFLFENRNNQRSVPKEIDNGDIEAIK
ncbi:MAG TPA: hypothetical protein EYO61_00680, partial [Campylobacterales bacterium]|nr:hypothetical protein [Campylobacterales bacterium]